MHMNNTSILSRSRMLLYDIDLLLDMFVRKHFSDEGTSSLIKERAAFMFFRGFLDDCEG